MFSFQPDGSTDVANCSQLLVYVRCINDGDSKVELLQTSWNSNYCMWYIWHGSFLKEHKICGKGLWYLHRWCSSYASLSIWMSTLGTDESPKGTGTHCMTNQQLLAMKTLPQELTKSSKYKFFQFCRSKHFKLSTVVKTAPNKALLFHTEERWFLFFQDRLSPSILLAVPEFTL